MVEVTTDPSEMRRAWELMLKGMRKAPELFNKGEKKILADHFPSLKCDGDCDTCNMGKHKACPIWRRGKWFSAITATMPSIQNGDRKWKTSQYNTETIAHLAQIGEALDADYFSK